MLVRRDTGAKTMDVPLEGLPETLAELFGRVHADMLHKARGALTERLRTVTQWADFVPALNAQRLVVAAWCDTVDCEKAVKHDSSEEAKHLVADGFALTAAAKTLCIPADQSIAGQPLPEKCFHCQNQAKVWCLFGRSY